MFNRTLIIGLALGLSLAHPAAAGVVWLKGSDLVCKNSMSVSASNPQGIIGLGNIDSAGNFNMTIINPSDGVVSPSGRGHPCTIIPKTGPSSAPVPIVFSGVMPARYNVLNAIRAGTGGVEECLKQGSNLTGIGSVAGSALTTTTTLGTYTLTLRHQLTSDGCEFGANPVTRYTQDGQPTFLRGATLTGGASTFNGSYYVFDPNAFSPIPEPGSLALLLAGVAAALGLNLLTRRRITHHA
ncbi:MAG: PEP-CTERM sorting domain-containing protein [Pseudomonadota bacterium]|nr:PEP-CTERM sorting domain-containing protein [Pseudomonadota bacterium]MDP1905119.1 PEP-CTERM sorting domain-containing protein [Pseudomonadota bacterium]MDP2351975.1 PEP-CTERM sorting domain-containing protein [Pseudomonadota bacterium]